MSSPIQPEPTGGAATGAPASGDWFTNAVTSGPSSDLPDFSTVDSGASTAEESRQQKHGWFQNFLHKTFDIGHYSQPTADPRAIKEAARSTVKGLTNVVGQGAQTAVDLAVTGRNIMASGDPLIPESKKKIASPDVAGAVEHGVTKVIGKSADDGIAHFVESTSQLVGSVLTTRMLGVTNTLAEGAVSFGAFFDPHEGGLSELLKTVSDKLPDGVARNVLGTVGDLGSVDADTPGAIARLKRAGEGFGLALPFEALAWTARISGLSKAAKAAETPAEKAVIATKLDEATAELEKIQSRPKPVSVEERPDGTFTLKEEPKPIPATPDETQVIPGVTKRDDGTYIVRGFRGVSGARHPLEPGIGEATFISPHEDVARGYATQGGREAEGTVVKIDTTLKNPLILDDFRGPLFDTRDLGEVIQYAKEQGHDGLIIKSGTRGFPEVAAFDQNTLDVAPIFASRGDAEALANGANEVVEAQARAADPILFTEDQVRAHGEIADRILNAKDGEDAARLAGGSHFNFDYLAGPDRVKAQIEAVAEQFGEKFHAARVTEGVTVEEAFKKAQTLAAQYGIEDFATRFNNKSAAVVEFYADLLASHAAISELGQKLSSLYDVFRVRPDDPVLFQNAKNLLEMWSGLLRDVSGAESEIGRTMRFMQERNNPLMEGVKFASESTPEAKATVKTGATPATVPPENPEALKTARKATTKAKTDITDLKESLPKLKVQDTFNQVPVTASDFSLGRARMKAEAIRARLKKVGIDLPEFSVQEPASSKRAIDIRNAADRERSGSLPKITEAEQAALDADKAARSQPVNPVEALSKWLDDAQTEIGKVETAVKRNAERRALAKAKAEGRAFETDKKSINQTPVDILKKEAEADRLLEERLYKQRQAGDVRGFLHPDMTPERVEDWLRLFKMANGDVRYAPDVLASQKIVDAVPKELAPKVSHYAEQVFTNALISGVKTQQTIAATGLALQSYEAMMRVFAGVGTLNTALAREGADQLFSFFSHALDDMKGGLAAMRAGRSLVDPPLAIHARGGLTNRIINAPGDVATGLDERTRLSSFRAIVRAKSLRLAREEGLSGAELATRVDRDLRLALGDGTGIAQNMLALKQARLPTLSGSLGPNTIGGKVSDLVNSIPFFRLVTPFINVGVHGMRYVNKSTPVLNLFYKDVRATLANGGEEAVVLYAKMAAATATFVTAYHLAATGVITGRGPSNPKLRKEWNRQAYSGSVNGKDRSYRRFDPFASYIGIAADLATLHAEAAADGSDDETMGQATQAVFASYMSNVVNKTYMVGLSNFLKAASEQDGASLDNLIGSTASGFIPRAIQQFNTDSVYREARGLVDRLMNATPGLSDNLPADYLWDGTPHLKSQGMWNRQGSIVPSQVITPKLEDKLVDNGIVLSPPSKRENGIDYTDPSWSTDGSRPYDRWMELVAASGIRKTLEEITKSPAWDNAPQGSPGSGAKKRAILLQARLDAVQEQAFHKMLAEPRYRKLNAAWIKSRSLGAQNIQGGKSAVDSLKNVIDSIRTSPPEAAKAIFAQ